jgi:VanZ family protein
MGKNPAHFKLRVNTTRWLRLVSWFAVAAWALGIFILSSLSGSKIEEINVLNVWDKAAHFSAFAVGAALLALALRWSTAWPWRRIVLVAIAAISVFGATDEWHQLYTPKRSGADVGDWLADSLGACAGTAATFFIHARHRPKSCPAPRGA